MQFTYNETKYRIRFAHSPSLNPDCHRTHQVYLTRKTVNTVMTGPTFLVCRTCSERYGRQIVLAPVAKRDRARLTWCQILAWRNETWELVSEGVARPRAGELYTNEGGRRVALVNALGTVERDLRLAAHHAYDNRALSAGKPKAGAA